MHSKEFNCRELLFIIEAVKSRGEWFDNQGIGGDEQLTAEEIKALLSKLRED